jgi:Membrane fusion protein Use1.
LLLQIERSLPKIKPVDRRHGLQTDLARKRQTLNLLKDGLDAISADAEMLGPEGDEEDFDTGISSEDGDELLATPGESVEENEIENEVPLAEGASQRYIEEEGLRLPTEEVLVPSTTTTAPTPTATTDAALRHRHNRQSTLSATTDAAAATATATALPTPSSLSKTQATEFTLDAHRQEQENLTDSLLSLASQLKASSQSFQTSLEAEKSVLARAVEGLDRISRHGRRRSPHGAIATNERGKGLVGTRF